ncbi:MAG: OmpH family outer membrane protein [Alphaproteobacteria bacterium]|nr:OmpH family outer membrane protein [Alphaproteobacteria bacterium]
MFFRLIASLLLLLFALPAQAADFIVLTVDYGRAIQEIDEGKAAQSRLDRMYEGKKAEIEQLEQTIMSLQQEYQAKGDLLSAEARQGYEQRLYDLQVQYQQAYAAADMQMQQAYFTSMEQLMNRLKVVSEELGAERKADLVLEISQGSVLYAKSGMDMTDAVIARYNQKFASAQ